jgi:hypothetical protein
MGRPLTEAATYRGLMIRLPDATLQACKREAAKERRSLNAQLLCVIDEWLQEKAQKRDHAFSGSDRD